ncbi:hypothetical protein A9Q99_20525 [Gammaproteobacteria bacterium 45_16_T64]|nr:hypothetical protein A9Q99_20525 [Gammaproteobacteria bacterium 45_16_T64]
MVDTNQASRQKFTQLFHQHQHELLRLLSAKVSNVQDAEDILQDLFIKVSAFDNQSSKDIDNPKHYLFKIANNMALDFLRRKSRQTHYFSDENVIEFESTKAAVDSPDRILVGQQQADQLRKALTAMPTQRRQAFLLFKYRNLTRSQISVELNLSIDAVEKHLVRALKNCRDALKRGEAID